VDDAWAQNTLPDDDISIPQVLPPAAPEGGGPGGAPAGSGCRACARHGALAPPQGHEVPSEDEAEEADGAGAETLPPTHAAAAAHARLSPGGPAEFLGPP